MTRGLTRHREGESASELAAPGRRVLAGGAMAPRRGDTPGRGANDRDRRLTNDVVSVGERLTPESVVGSNAMGIGDAGADHEPSAHQRHLSWRTAPVQQFLSRW